MAGSCMVGIDPGERWIGVARAMTGSSLALPVGTLDRSVCGQSTDEIARALESLLGGDDIIGLVVGAPLRPDGAEDEQASAFRVFGEGIAAAMGIECFTQNERFTSVSREPVSRERSTQRGRKARRPGAKSAARRRRDHERSHAESAARILQRWLDERPELQVPQRTGDG